MSGEPVISIAPTNYHMTLKMNGLGLAWARSCCIVCEVCRGVREILGPGALGGSLV